MMSAKGHILPGASTFLLPVMSLEVPTPPMPDSAIPPPISDPLLSRNLIAYLASRVCSGTAMTMLRAAIAWHVFALTNSAFHLGLIGLVQFYSALEQTLLGGAPTHRPQ